MGGGGIDILLLGLGAPWMTPWTRRAFALRRLGLGNRQVGFGYRVS